MVKNRVEKQVSRASQQSQEKEHKKMAGVQLQFIRRSTLPQGNVGKGAVPSIPKLSIGPTGQIIFSAAASKALGGPETKHVGMGFVDAKKRQFGIIGFTTLPKGEKPEDYFTPRFSSKGGHMYFGAGNALFSIDPKTGKQVGAGYDYKATGKKSFPVEVDEAQHLITFTLPEGKVEGDKIVPRNKRPKPETKPVDTRDDLKLEEEETKAA